MRGPVAAHIVVISGMVAASVGTQGADAEAVIPVGAVAFFLSVLFVARDRIVRPGLVDRL